MTSASSPVRVMVVDDEPLAREHLIALLADEPEMRVVAEAGGGSEAVRLIKAEKPDVVFLDVQMPGLNGFDVLRSIPGDERPLVVFVTAYDAHAINAFEVSAVDYLLKPVGEERLRVAVRRAIERAAAPRARDVLTQLSALVERFPVTVERIPIPIAGRVLFVAPREIDWVDADDDQIRVHVGKTVHVMRETMANMEARLKAGFIRVHRSALVNVERIREVQPWVKGDYVVILQDGTRVTTGRTYRDRVKALLK
ncbi:MAG TPA: LytTR family DNA-binding domain-containing protein [Gemmatimonadaceae bacterium]